MNSNSFTIKGWMITIVSALLALYANSNNEIFMFIAIVPTFIFWLLDAFYLAQECRFRCLYDDVIHDRITPVFSMKPKDNTVCYFEVLWSKTIWPLYLPVIVALLIGGFILKDVL
jgi:hypothetical protein